MKPYGRTAARTGQFGLNLPTYSLQRRSIHSFRPLSGRIRRLERELARVRHKLQAKPRGA